MRVWIRHVCSGSAPGGRGSYTGYTAACHAGCSVGQTQEVYWHGRTMNDDLQHRPTNEVGILKCVEYLVRLSEERVHVSGQLTLV